MLRSIHALRTLRFGLALAFVAAHSAILTAQTDPNQIRAGGAPPSKDAIRFGSPLDLPANETRESMWPAPTAEDWKSPCLITWQRTFDDALRVAKESEKPILVCVNMDGEIASEHFAGIRYRRPETAKLFDPYVCVIASVYRHNARDYDDEGKRIPCPRFGTVTCGEHIAMESTLYDKFFDGKRISPRHIEIDLTGKISYDVYFSWDTKTVFTALVEGVKDLPPPTPLDRGDRPIVSRTASPDVVDRAAVEVAYQTGNRDVRRTLIESTMTHHDLDEVDLLRLAIFGLDADLAKLARKALCRCETEAAVDLIAEALKVPMDASERDALLAAAARLAEKFPRARTLIAVQQGLAKSSSLIDVQGWTKSIDDGASARSAYELAASVESRAAATNSRPEDAAARLDFAESLLARAEEQSADRRFAPLIVEDAERSALEAQRLGAKGWRLDALLAVTANAAKKHDEALTHAVAAVEGGMPRPGNGAEGVQERNAVTVLALFAEARQHAIAKAYRSRSPWPPEWLADIHAAYAVLVRHPFGTDEHVVAYVDFLNWLGATPRAAQVLDEGIARFPSSWLLHDRLRAKLLWDKGPDGLESAYAAMLAKPDAPQALEWFAGYASLVAAERHRRSNEPDQALSSYAHAVELYQRDVAKHPEHASNADHYLALADAGRARLALEAGDLERATDAIIASFRRKPDAASSPDGLNISAVDTAMMLRSKIDAAKRADLAAKLKAALEALDPKLLELPAYEREVPADRPARGERPLRGEGGH